MAPSGRVSSDSQTALSLVLYFKLYKTKAQALVVADRLVWLARRNKFKVSTGFAGTAIVLQAFSLWGHANIAYGMLMNSECPGWLYPISMGATTPWERWDSMLPDGTVNTGDMTSFNHYAFGSVGDWLHTVVGGLQPIEPGYKRFLVRPIPGGTLRSANLSYDSVSGSINIAWSVKNDKDFTLNLEVPQGTTALVVLPEQGLTKLDEEERLKFGQELGSGSHILACVTDCSDEWPPAPRFRTRRDL